jgi:LysM repeat protein
MKMTAVQKTKVTRKIARAIVGTSLLVVIGAGFSAVGHASTTSSSQSSSADSYMTVVVAPGETLWSIAGMVGGNSSAVVDQIIDANHLRSSEVQAGQKLLVPLK